MRSKSYFRFGTTIFKNEWVCGNTVTKIYQISLLGTKSSSIENTDEGLETSCDRLEAGTGEQSAFSPIQFFTRKDHVRSATC